MNYMQQPPDAPNPINYFAPSPLANPHRRAFSTYAADASQLGNHGISASMFAADDLAVLGLDDGGDHSDPKRRRIARACDMCRKKKIKCDGKMPACTHCQNYKTECVFTQVEKKRNPPKGAKYIEGLENRLGRMESLLRLSGLLSEDDLGATDLGTLEKRLADKAAQHRDSESSKRNSTPGAAAISNGEGSTPATEPTRAGSEKPTNGQPSPDAEKSPGSKQGDEEVEALSDMMCSLVTNNCGETRYIGSSSGFSIFSPKGITWVNQKTGDTSFQDMITASSVDDNKWITWKPDIFRDIFQRRIYKPLPPKAEALSLLKDYFANFNCMFPLFHEPTFMNLVEQHYSQDPYEGSGWWASLNVALAIAHRLRVMSNLVPQEEDQKAWGYMKNALAVQNELTIRNTDLLSVQALLGMSMFLQGTPNPQPSFFLVAAAIRLAHSIGLHKRATGFGLDPNEVEQRKRVFWIAYMLDKDICLRSGRPPIQDDDDMNVDLPSEDPPDNVGNIPLADGKGKVNLFRLMCTFAVLASKVYRQLYAVKASKQSDGELLNTIGELDRELEEWKDGIPIDFRPEHEIKASHTPLILHVVVLHFAYYNCLTTIHRMSVHHGYWTSRLSNFAIQGLNARPLNPRVFSSAALCVSAARASIHLIKYIPQGDYDCVWLILYYPVSALVTLFANILQNPQDSRARADLKLMNHVVSFLSMLCTDDANSSVRRMLSICSEFERIAKVVLDKTDKESSSRRKRKQAEASANGGSVNGDAARTPSVAATPHVTPYIPATPQPSQPGNIPNVFTPPDMSAYMNDEPYSSMANLSPEMNPSSLANATSNGNSTWLSPRQSPSQLPNSSPPLSNPPTTGSFDFSVPPTASGAARPIKSIPNRRSPSAGPATPRANGGSYIPGGDPLQLGQSFQHPFVPQDLWQMPMTLEWDWADMTSGLGGMQDVISHFPSGSSANGPANGNPTSGSGQ